MILLSFDIEEFGVPLEHGIEVPFEQQMAVSIEGTRKILACLKRHQIHATFFCTANFAAHAPEIIENILQDGHEIASHGYYHSSFEMEDLKRSREFLEQQTGQPVKGFRMARMMPIDEKEIKKAGYTYNSSLNPTCIPGRYNHLDKPRTWFYKDDVLQLPASVSPVFRFPLFWLAYHNLPAKVYRWLFQRTLKHDGYIVTYFHPWEFTNLKKWNLPFIITNHSGEGMIKRLDDLISFSIKKDYTFMTFSSFQQNIIQNGNSK
mgnify:FL=1